MCLYYFLFKLAKVVNDVFKEKYNKYVITKL